MRITSVSVKPIINAKCQLLRGTASVVFDNCFCVHSIKIIERMDGRFFIAMPSMLNNGEHHDICHPINSSFREELENAILEVYRKEIEKLQSEPEYGKNIVSR